MKNHSVHLSPLWERLGLRDLAVLVGVRPSQRREAGEEAVIRLQH